MFRQLIFLHGLVPQQAKEEFTYEYWKRNAVRKNFSNIKDEILLGKDLNTMEATIGAESKEDMLYEIRKTIREQPDLSNTEIARLCGVYNNRKLDTNGVAFVRRHTV